MISPSLFLAAAEAALEELADGHEDDNEPDDLEREDDGRRPSDQCRGGSVRLGGRGGEPA